MKSTIKTTILSVLIILIGLGLIATIVNGINAEDPEIKISSSSTSNNPGINETFKIEDIPADEWDYNWGPLL